MMQGCSDCNCIAIAKGTLPIIGVKKRMEILADKTDVCMLREWENSMS